MELYLDIAVSLVGLVVVGQFTWALRAHFSSTKIPDGTKLISAVVIITTVFFLFLLWAGSQPSYAQMIGVVIQLAGACLFWLSIFASQKARLRLAFDEENPDSIVMTGPYRFVRHPFYTSYLIFWIGFAIAAWNIWVLPFVAALVTIYVNAALSEQRKFANTAMAAEYEAYRRRTGLFWPRLPF